MVTIDQLLYDDVEDFSGFTATVTAATYPETGHVSWQRVVIDTDTTLLETHPTAKRAAPISLKVDIDLHKARERNYAYRKRRKAELEALRRQEAELKRTLVMLTQHKSQRKRRPGSGDKFAVVAWKALARRQRDKRLEAVALQQLLQAAVSILQALEKKPALNVQDSMLYNAYFDSLRVVYDKLDKVFDEVGTNSTQGCVFGGQPERKLDGETEYLEKKWVGRVPFTFQKTCEAVWVLASAPHRQDRRSVFGGLADSDNSVAVKYFVPIRTNGNSIELRTYQVARRYVEQSRVVVVWRALSDASDAFPGVNLDETGWCIIHSQTSDAASDADPHSTLVQACIRFTTMQTPDGRDQAEDTMSQFTALSMRTAVDDSLEIELMMDSLVLDDVLETDGLQFDETVVLSSTEISAGDGAIKV
ncbi:hypothetical protein PHYPSEUDO_005387 [Phytophthora pseudosyringae]|uniref:M96 mating-specific protein family n=1 Tax=Phytophthora pseudosyringae TaxID=221518 RepID=A0A8T1VM67_9STRA|nr:hypothetical protein PHYPSEUDO_005387 [Phytophthora pseudosyringae]